MWKQTGRVEIAVLNLLKEMYLNKKKQAKDCVMIYSLGQI